MLKRALIVAAGLAAAIPSHAGPFFFYKFTPVADTQTGFPFTQLDPFPSINGSGRVAFSGTLTGGVQGVFTRLGGSGGINVLSDTGVSEFFTYGIETSINALDRVAFTGLEDGPNGIVTVILRGEGVTATRLIDDSGSLSDFCGLQMNIEDSVVFRAERPNGTHEIRAQGAGPLTGVFRIVAEEGSEFSSLGCAPSISQDGTVAFTATRLGHRAIFTRARNGLLTQMIDDTSPFAGFDDVALNQTGGLAFTGSFHGGGRGLFRIRNGAIVKVVDTLTQNQGTPAAFSINESGTVAFELTRGANGSAVHLGPNNIFGRLVGTGSVLFNRSVLAAHLSRGGLNSTGQVVVTLNFFGPTMIARGEPVRLPDFSVITGGLLLSSALGGNVNAGTGLPTPPKGAVLAFDLTFLSLGGRLDVKLGERVVQSFAASEPGVRKTITMPLDPRLAPGGLQFVMSGKQGASAQISAITIPGIGSGPLDADALARWKIDESGRGTAAVVSVARYPMRMSITKAPAQDPRKPDITLVHAAALSDESVDTTADLDRASFRVAGLAPRECKAGYVDGDKFIDLLCEVELPDAALKSGVVPLEAMTYSGWAIEGSERFGDTGLRR